jgi:transcription elongation factor GreA-like protein
MKTEPGQFDDLENLPQKNGKIDWSSFEAAARKDLKKSKRKIEKQEDVDPYA